ncbi:MAG: transcription elongation factor GreAB [Ferruginibacter sp.]|nr:transcription elongation factor GreAB [Ferruginibacter sp.]
MQKIQQNPVVISESDYQLLKTYTDRMPQQDGEMTLAQELKRAIVVKQAALPPNTIAINSAVTIMDLDSGRLREFVLVMPEHANFKEGRVSILTPMGAALIGFRKGEELSWKVPLGIKRFKVTEVKNVL